MGRIWYAFVSSTTFFMDYSILSLSYKERHERNVMTPNGHQTLVHTLEYALVLAILRQAYVDLRDTAPAQERANSLAFSAMSGATWNGCATSRTSTIPGSRMP